MAMEFLKSAERKARDALSTSIGSIFFSGSDHRRRLFGRSNFGSLNDDGNQLLASQAELQPPAPARTPDLEAAAAAAAVLNSSGGGGGGDGDGRSGRGRGSTAAAEEARISNTSNSRTIGELAVPILGCMGIYSTIRDNEQLQHLHPSLYFPLLTFLGCGAYASLYSVFYALTKPAAGEEGGGEESEVVKREWLKVALACTGLALTFRVALGFIN